MGICDSGFEIEEAVFSAEECDVLLIRLAESSNSGGRAGRRHLMSNRAVKELAHDERLLRIAQSALGGSAVPYRATLFSKSSDANWLIPWHQDTALALATRIASPEWQSWSNKLGILYAHAPTWALNRVIALRVHLEASTCQNGPLRVIPGSQRAGVLTDQEVLDYARSDRQLTCPIPRGGVLAMRPLLIHSSSKSDRDQSSRRVLHIEYGDSLELRPGIQLSIA
jgi:ectoine hydroxylase-related dioxygenase (phytanoyl-CoA dioxygenase family)